MKKLCLFFMMLVFLTLGHAQNMSSEAGEASIGVGGGLPYGGIGGRIGYNVADQLNLYGGIGYNLVDVGFNIGLLYSFPTTSQTEIYFTGMYGYNAAILVENWYDQNNDFKEVYYGPSFGGGVKINSRKTEGNFWDIGLLLPIRSSGFNNMNDLFKDAPNIEGYTAPWPIMLTIGYNWNL